MRINSAIANLETFRLARLGAFRWSRKLSIAQKIVLALGIAVLTGLAAQVRIPLPWTPVPVTMQTMAALLAGVLLGRWWGGISMALYVGMGALGLPWFASWSGGMSYLAGPTGGYTVGFILAALFIGHLTDDFVKKRGLTSLFVLLLAANFILIYVPGLTQLGIWLNMIKGEPATLSKVLTLGLVPFIVGDIIKVAAAALLARGILPGEAPRNSLLGKSE